MQYPYIWSRHAGLNRRPHPSLTPLFNLLTKDNIFRISEG